MFFCVSMDPSCWCASTSSVGPGVCWKQKLRVRLFEGARLHRRLSCKVRCTGKCTERFSLGRRDAWAFLPRDAWALEALSQAQTGPLTSFISGCHERLAVQEGPWPKKAVKSGRFHWLLVTCDAQRRAFSWGKGHAGHIHRYRNRTQGGRYRQTDLTPPSPGGEGSGDAL
jgi:hypothetical protein